MTDGLNESYRIGIRSVLQAYPKIRRAILFGSRAISTYRAASDVDLALEGDNIMLADVMNIKGAIGSLNLPIEVDLVVREMIDNPDLEDHIRRCGKEFYRRS